MSHKAQTLNMPRKFVAIGLFQLHTAMSRLLLYTDHFLYSPAHRNTYHMLQ